MSIVPRRMRQPLEASTVGTNSIDLVVAVTLAGERDPVAARRPGRKRVEVRAGLELSCCAPRAIENVEIPHGTGRSSKDDVLSVGRPTRHAGVGAVSR